MKTGDRLISLMLDGENGKVANSLLGEIYRGYPARNLLALLESTDESALKTGVWIASEIAGGRAEDLMETFSVLAGHRLP